MNVLHAIIGLVVLSIIVFSVTVPIINDAVASANLTGTSKTLADLIPLFLTLGVLVGFTAFLIGATNFFEIVSFWRR